MYFIHRSLYQLLTVLKRICFKFNSDSTTFTEHLWVTGWIILGVFVHHLSFGYKGSPRAERRSWKGSRDQASPDILPPCSGHPPAGTTGPPGDLGGKLWISQLHRAGTCFWHPRPPRHPPHRPAPLLSAYKPLNLPKACPFLGWAPD